MKSKTRPRCRPVYARSAPQKTVWLERSCRMHSLQNLIKYGQSYWLDNLTRGMMTSNALHTRVTTQGLRGMTSNPSTFDKAISGSSDYDEHIAQLVRDGQTVDAIYERLVVKDVQDACDILRPVYDAAEGQDG